MPVKIIHQIIGPRKNDLIYACMYSWDVMKTFGFDIFIWDDNRIEVFLKKYYPFAVDAFLKARNYAEAADIARYLIVYHFGGYYMDWDIQLLNASDVISIVKKNPDGFLVVDPVNSTLASECFSAIEKEPFLLSLTEDIIDIYNCELRPVEELKQFDTVYKNADSSHAC